MNRRLVIIGATILTFVSLGISLFLFRPAKPIVDIKGEKLWMIHSFGNQMIDIKITNTLLTAWVIMAVLLLFWFFVRRKNDMVPRGLQNFGESIIEVIYNFVVGIAGEKNGRRFFPLVATFFIYIAFANWISLAPVFNSIGIWEPLKPEASEFSSRAVVAKDSGITIIAPGAKAIEAKPDTTACNALPSDQQDACVTKANEDAIASASQGKVKSGEKVGVLAPFFRGINTDLMTPASFAIVSAFFVEYWGISTLGFFRYSSRFFNFGGLLRGIKSFNPGAIFYGFIDAGVGILESVAELARIISFSFRLFGNLLAGEILLLVMTFLVPLVSAILIVFYGLELFVGAIQAFVFGALTLVFAVQATAHHGGGEEHAEEAHH